MHHHMKTSERGSNGSKSIDKLHFTNYEYHIWTLKHLYVEYHALTNRKRKSQITWGKKFKKVCSIDGLDWTHWAPISHNFRQQIMFFHATRKFTFDKSDHSPIRTSPIYGYVKITIFLWVENWNILSNSVAFTKLRSYIIV